MINVSPVGRNCSQEERDDFEKHDLAAGIRWVGGVLGWAGVEWGPPGGGDFGDGAMIQPRANVCPCFLLDCSFFCCPRLPACLPACLPALAPACPPTCRKKFVETLRERFAHMDLNYSVGGQISFDVFPRVRLGGWVGGRVGGRAGGWAGGGRGGGGGAGGRVGRWVCRVPISLSACVGRWCSRRCDRQPA